jgi:hypothetical protein
MLHHTMLNESNIWKWLLQHYNTKSNIKWGLAKIVECCLTESEVILYAVRQVAHLTNLTCFGKKKLNLKHTLCSMLSRVLFLHGKITQTNQSSVFIINLLK